MNSPDINDLLEKIYKEKVLPASNANNMKHISRRYWNDIIFKSLYTGSSYVL